MGVVRTLIPSLVLAMLVMSGGVMSAQGDAAGAAAREWRLRHESTILDEFMRHRTGRGASADGRPFQVTRSTRPARNPRPRS